MSDKKDPSYVPFDIYHKDMMDLQKRISRMEIIVPGFTAVVVVIIEALFRLFGGG